MWVEADLCLYCLHMLTVGSLMKWLIYTASKVKHRLNIFLEKTVKLSKHDFFLVTFLKRDKVVTIYSKFRFDYH